MVRERSDRRPVIPAPLTFRACRPLNYNPKTIRQIVHNIRIHLVNGDKVDLGHNKQCWQETLVRLKDIIHCRTSALSVNKDFCLKGSTDYSLSPFLFESCLDHTPQMEEIFPCVLQCWVDPRCRNRWKAYQVHTRRT